MKKTLTIALETHAPLEGWSAGEGVLAPLFGAKRLAPQRVATFGEVSARHGVDVETLEDCRAHWGTTAVVRGEGGGFTLFEDFNWKRARAAKSTGRVRFPRKATMGHLIQGGLHFEAEPVIDLDWLDLFSEWCTALQPFGGFLHPAMHLERAARIEMQGADVAEISQRAFSRFLTGQFHCAFRAGELNSLVSGVTDLGWAKYFGGDLAEEVDRSKISRAGFPIEELSGGYLVLVSRSIGDVEEDFHTFARRRSELKALFREGLFLVVQ